MKNCLLFALCLFLMACSSDSANQTPDTPAATAVSAAIPATPRVVRDTIKRPIKTPISRSQYAVNRSRNKEQMVSTFPYDIDLKKANETTVKSDQVLVKNGKPTVLLFWLTTCFPCSMEMKAIKEKYATWQQEADFNLYAISTDFEKNFPKFIQKVNENKWPWETYNDVNREFRQVLPGGLNGLPQTFVLDKNGEIVYHKRKYRPGDEDILFAKVKEIASR